MASQPTYQGVLYLVKAGEVQFDISFPLSAEGEITLGRDPNCDILLDLHTSVSRRHAVIRPLKGQPEKWVIYDLNSSNGTFINGRRLEKEHLLKAKDKISLAIDGPCFQFDYQQLTFTIPQKKNNLLSISNQQTIKDTFYNVELFPTKLVININAPFYSSKVTSYIFDLDTEQLTISYRRNFVDWFFAIYPEPKQYSLEEFTAVRLDKSEYKGTRKNKYELYTIYLQREQGKDIQLETQSQITNSSGYSQMVTGIDERKKAEKIVNIIEQYLEQI